MNAYRPLQLLHKRIDLGLPVGVRDEAHRRLDAFVDRFRVRASEITPCLHRLTGRGLGATSRTGCTRYLCRCPDRLEGGRYWDHVNLWNRDGRPYVVTSEPYDLDGQGIRELRLVLAGDGLTVETSRSASWWYPGETTLVLIRRIADAAKEPASGSR